MNLSPPTAKNCSECGRPLNDGTLLAAIGTPYAHYRCLVALGHRIQQRRRP